MLREKLNIEIKAEVIRVKNETKAQTNQNSIPSYSMRKVEVPRWSGQNFDIWRKEIENVFTNISD